MPEPVCGPEPRTQRDDATAGVNGDRERVAAKLREAAESLRVLEAAVAADRVVTKARAALYEAGRPSRALKERKTYAEITRGQLKQAARWVYAKPEEAVDALLEHARDEETLTQAKELLRKGPWYFGDLSRREGYRTAKRNARGLADRLDYAARDKWELSKAEELASAAEEELGKAKAALKAALEARAAVSERSHPQLMERVALALKPLLSVMDREKIERLGGQLAPGAASLLPQALKAAVDLAEGPRRGRGLEIW